LLAVGLTVFAIGLFKKVGLADSMQVYVNPLFATANSAPLGLTQAWLAAIAFTLQIYFDFSAYSDMAIGLAYMLGVRLPLNFNSPLQSASIIEFWRRWHITLSSFLRDYLYIPLGGGRKGFARQIGNILVVMVLGGLWHGAGFTFLVWGFLHGVFLALNHSWSRFKPDLVLTIPRSIRVTIAWLLTFLCVVVTFVIFRAESMGAAMNVITGMVGLNGIDSFMGGCLLTKFLSVQCPYLADIVNGNELLVRQAHFGQVWASVLACIGIVLLLPNTARFMRRVRPVTFEKRAEPVAALLAIPAWRPTALWAALTILLLFYSLSEIENAKQFIYFQF
jgi:alginate O-acetyltransferase complex protein AlgI